MTKVFISALEFTDAGAEEFIAFKRKYGFTQLEAVSWLLSLSLNLEKDNMLRFSKEKGFDIVMPEKMSKS